MTQETEQKLAEIISDEEIANVHRGDFGGMTPRNVVNDGVRKAALGYHSGHTQFSILRSHGLITAPRGMNPDYNLTKKGKKYARALMHSAIFPAAPSPDTGKMGGSFTVDELAQEIRRVDGNHSLGAGALAEALMPFLSRAPVSGVGMPASVKELLGFVEWALENEQPVNPEHIVALSDAVKDAYQAPVSGGGEDDAVILLQARYVLKDLHAKNPNCGYGKMADACERAAAPVSGGDGEAVALPDIAAEGERIVRDTYRPEGGGYLWTDVVGAVQTAIAEERARHTHPSDPATGRWYAAEDIDRMVRDIDVAMNGDGAARQAKLCDIYPEIIKLARAPNPSARGKTVREWLDEPEGHGIRMERLVEDLENGADIIPWLEAAASLKADPDATERMRAALDHPLLREVLGFVEDAAPDEVMANLRLWQDAQRAALGEA